MINWFKNSNFSSQIQSHFWIPCSFSVKFVSGAADSENFFPNSLKNGIIKKKILTSVNGFGLDQNVITSKFLGSTLIRSFPTTSPKKLISFFHEVKSLRRQIKFIFIEARKDLFKMFLKLVFVLAENKKIIYIQSKESSMNS